MKETNTLQGLGQAVDKVVGSTNNSFPVKMHNGSIVTVFTCKVKHVGPLARFVQEAFDILDIKKLSDLSTVELQEPAVYLKLISNGVDSLFSVASMLCTLSYEAFCELEIDDAVAIIMKEVEVNKDFFMSRVLPLLGSLNPSESQTQTSEELPTLKKVAAGRPAKKTLT